MNKCRRKATESNKNYQKILIVSDIWSIEYNNPNACHCWMFIIGIIWSKGQHTDISKNVKTEDREYQHL